MTDMFDRAAELEQAHRDAAIEAHQHRRQAAPLSDDCIDCGEPISEARRRAVPSCVRCIECQNIREGRR